LEIQNAGGILMARRAVDYDILKSLKFTSQFNGNVRGNYNFEDTQAIWQVSNNPANLSSVVLSDDKIVTIDKR
jgi:hypothetical protein